MATPEPGERNTHRRAPDPSRPHRGAVLLGTGTLALVLATTGIVAARTGRSASTPTQQRSARDTRVVVTAPAATTRTKKSPTAPQPEQTPIEQATLAPILEDGTYPSYIRGVDVGDATVTVDVVQVFEDEDAAKAAIEDGTPHREAKYLYIYVRNENDLLRTLPVSEDVRIRFIGGCESGDRHLALEELSKETTPFTTTYYYSVTVTAGAIDHIVQHVAIPAC